MSYGYLFSSGYHLGRANTVDNDHIILYVEYETPAAVVAHHSAGFGMVLPYVGHRARPVQVSIHRERLHFGNHHIKIPACAFDTHHREQEVGQVFDVEPRSAGNSNPVVFHISQGIVAKPRQSILPPSSARFRAFCRHFVLCRWVFGRVPNARYALPLVFLLLLQIPYQIVLFSICKSTKNYRNDKIYFLHAAKSYRPALQSAERRVDAGGRPVQKPRSMGGADYTFLPIS